MSPKNQHKVCLKKLTLKKRWGYLILHFQFGPILKLFTFSMFDICLFSTSAFFHVLLRIHFLILWKEKIFTRVKPKKKKKGLQLVAHFKHSKVNSCRKLFQTFFWGWNQIETPSEITQPLQSGSFLRTILHSSLRKVKLWRIPFEFFWKSFFIFHLK